MLHAIILYVYAVVTILIPNNSQPGTFSCTRYDYNRCDYFNWFLTWKFSVLIIKLLLLWKLHIEYLPPDLNIDFLNKYFTMSVMHKPYQKCSFLFEARFVPVYAKNVILTFVVYSTISI